MASTTKPKCWSTKRTCSHGSALCHTPPENRTLKGADSLAQTFDLRALVRVLLPELDEQFDKLLTSPSRDFFTAPPESVYLLVVGGAAMMTYRPERMTTDVDTITTLHQAVITAAQTVAAEHGLRRDWLNDQTASSDLPAAAAHTDTIFQGKRITVAHPGPQYLLGGC